MKIIICLMAVLILLGGCMSKQKLQSKSIEACVESAPNYLFHLLSVANIGYDNTYSEKHMGSISAEDRELLKSSARLIEVPSQYQYNFAWLLVFFPGYMNLEDDEIRAYFQELKHVFKEKEWQRFEEKYSNDLNYARKQFGDFREYLERLINSAPQEDIDNSVKICDVIMNNYAFYRDNIWEEQKAILQSKADSLNIFLNEYPPFDSISELVGVKYDDDKFRVTLCSSIENGPDAMDLGFDKNLHYYNRRNEDLRHFILHELVIRYILPFRNRFYTNYQDVDEQLLYQITEMTAEMYTCLILQDGDGFAWFPDVLKKLRKNYTEGIHVYDLIEKTYTEIIEDRL